MKGKWIYVGALLFGLSLGIGGLFGILGFSICSIMMIYDSVRKNEITR